MPVYVYRNLVTNETFEYQQRITEDALTVDPRTGDPVRRVIQPVGIAFKGSGFYVNDSRSGGSKTSSGSSKAAEATASSSDGAGASSAADSSASKTTSSEKAPSAATSAASAG